MPSSAAATDGYPTVAALRPPCCADAPAASASVAASASNNAPLNRRSSCARLHGPGRRARARQVRARLQRLDLDLAELDHALVVRDAARVLVAESVLQRD